MGNTKRTQRIRHGLVWLVCAGLVAGVAWTATSCLHRPEAPTRAPTLAEVHRLAALRSHNLAAGPVDIIVTMPDASGGGGMTGRIDWSQPLLTAATTPAGDSRPNGFVQAVPGLVASHPADPDIELSALPDTGWTVRRTRTSAGDTAATDIALSALLALGGDSDKDPDTLAGSSTWIKEASIDGAVVDVFRAPLLLDAASDPTSTDAPEDRSSGTSAAAGVDHPAVDTSATALPGRTATPEGVFWVDRDGGLRRVQFDPAGTGLVTADFLWDRSDTESDHPVPILGGAVNEPRELSGAEVTRLAGMRVSNAARTAEVDIELPVGDDEMVHATGWVDWRMPMVYLALDAPGDDNDGLLFAMVGGVATRAGAVEGHPPAVPDSTGWSVEPWADRVVDGRPSELDSLLFKLLVLTSPQPDDEATVAEVGSWLRADDIDGDITSVVEFPIAGDTPTDRPGLAPYRYWIDDTGGLRRVELRVDGLGMAHADLADTDAPQVVVPDAVLSGLTGG